MQSKVIAVSIPKELLQKVDTCRKKKYCNRSEFIRQAVADACKRSKKDE